MVLWAPANPWVHESHPHQPRTCHWTADRSGRWWQSPHRGAVHVGVKSTFGCDFSPIFWEVLVRKSRERAEKGRKTFKSRGVQLEKIIYKWVSSKPWWHRYIKMAGGTSMGFWGTLPGTLPTGWASEILHQMMAYPVIIPFTVFHIITNRYPAWCRISPPSVCSNQPFFPMLFSCAGWGPWQLDLAGPTQGWSKLIIRQTY